jgi:hypothetical protein
MNDEQKFHIGHAAFYPATGITPQHIREASNIPLPTAAQLRSDLRDRVTTLERELTERLTELRAATARAAELEGALRPFANYAEKRSAKPIKGLGNSVHHIHPGTVWEAEITLSDCEVARAILAKHQPLAPSLPRPTGTTKGEKVKITRTWAMPNAATFSIKPIGDFVKRYLAASSVSIDPFCGDKRWATHCNDLRADKVHAETFLNDLKTTADLLILDPPYSPRQISECYKAVGLPVTQKDTQGSLKPVKDAAMRLLTPDAVVLSFGWNSNGMGKKRGFEVIEVLLVAHGGHHNDTICIAEKRTHTPSATTVKMK